MTTLEQKRKEFFRNFVNSWLPSTAGGIAQDAECEWATGDAGEVFQWAADWVKEELDKLKDRLESITPGEHEVVDEAAEGYRAAHFDIKEELFPTPKHEDDLPY